MSIKTILFDLDGTLLNTNELIRKSFIHTFEMYNIPYTEEDLIEYNGPPLEETFMSLDPVKGGEMLKEYRRFNVENHDQYVSLFPNSLEMLDSLREANIKTAIVTNKMRDVTLIGLQLTGLDQYFTPERIITLSDVSVGKPDPEGIHKAMATLKGAQSSTIIVGDSYHDIKAGQRAGIKTAGVTWSERGEEFLRSYHPTYMIHDLNELLNLIK